jgi:DNA-binding LytR/AlgR family response regulator
MVSTKLSNEFNHKTNKPMDATKYIHIGGYQEINPNEVVMLQADINYTILFFANGQKTIVATPLKTLESRLVPFDFYRTHKSYLINLKCVKRFLEATNIVQMTDNHKVIVSRRKRTQLKVHLANL